MKKLTFYSIVFSALLAVSCNNARNKDSTTKEPTLENNIKGSSIYVNLPVADIAILGTFHYVSNVDSYKRKYHIDVTSEKTQNEIKELLEKLKDYKPTKILVEQNISNQNYLDSLYQAYRKGNYELNHNESQQLGFRLAKMLNHEHIYAVNVHAPYDFEYEVDFDNWDDYAKETNHYNKWNSIKSVYNRHHEYLDSLKTTMPLLGYYKLLNSKEVTKAALQEKLSGLIELGATDTYLGADGIAHDYRRNLRIYVNTLSLIENSNDRFLLIIGSNHNTILQPLYKTSLEFNYTDIVDYLK
ncbi:DUF5694 domain-containing protein [Xanthomarina gelatinilytica]|uniref:DUF5694 domain-containing protein n=1 Tax=Xanthomarina gelatinilytica TaxID=1137281 RepID=UPI003AA8C1D8